jgi:hypothetical protein
VIGESKVRCNRSTTYQTIEVTLETCRQCSYYQTETDERISCTYPYTIIYSSSVSYPIKRSPRIETRYKCEICGRAFSPSLSKEKVARHESRCKAREERKRKSAMKLKYRDYDLNLLLTEGVPSYRRFLAIYRLYRNHNMSPAQIADNIGCSEKEVRDIIGLVFRELCSEDRECVFRRYFNQGSS